MTEVAQVEDIFGYDAEDVTNENEENTSGTENKVDDITHKEDNVSVNEPEETSEKTSQTEDKKPYHKNDDTSEETDETQVNGVEDKENRTDTVNGVTQEKEDSQPNANEEQNISDLALKKQVRPKGMIINTTLVHLGSLLSVNVSHHINQDKITSLKCKTSETAQIQKACGQNLRAKPK